MTLRQLAIFATVARLGSVKAAARELGDQRAGGVGGGRRRCAASSATTLYAPRGPRARADRRQGERLASLAGEIVALADRARAALGEARAGARGRCTSRSTGAVEEHVVGPLLAAFTERTPEVHATVEVEPPQRVRRAAGPPPRRHHARPAAEPGRARRGWSRAVPALPDDRRRAAAATGWPGARDVAPGRAGRRALAGRRRRRRAAARRPARTSRARGSRRSTCARSPATPPRCRPSPPARA